MQNRDEKEIWEEYKKRELEGALPILSDLGFKLDAEQPHTSGERYLMRAVTTTHGRKLILLGARINDNKKVVIKVTSDQAGKEELVSERKSKEILHKINFAYDIFLSPPEILFKSIGKYTVSIQAFVERESPFLDRDTKEQFMLALKAFKAQESAHATTYAHAKLIENAFGSMDSDEYIKRFREFKESTLSTLKERSNLSELLTSVEEFLVENKETIEQYTGFLTHTDFVPHNFRIMNGDIYLLDHSSMRFGNKYEGWARFINFMTLHNPELAKWLVKYIKDNRAEEESLSLKLMRVYRLGEIVWYYTNTLDKSSGDLYTLNKSRVDFWTDILERVLNDKEVPKELVEDYRKNRDSLRSEDEKKRQVGLL
ncbi:MAG: hypothetical protein ISR99_02965 [Parcubacteria group bacterium]|nr:hypothetical protein [Parcubacteria group bacterium]